MVTRFAYIVPLLAVGCLWALARDTRRRRRLARRFAGRPRLSAAEFARRHFPPEQVEIAQALREELQRRVGLDLSPILPEDRLEEDLEISHYGKTAETAFLMAVESRFGVELRHVPGVVVGSLGEVVREVARQRSGLPGAGAPRST